MANASTELLHPNTWQVLPRWYTVLAVRIASAHSCTVERFGVELFVSGGDADRAEVIAEYNAARREVDVATDRAAAEAGRPGRCWCNEFRHEAVLAYGVEPPRRRSSNAGGLRAAELRRESDDEVRRDVADEPELAALWEQVKHRIKAGERRSRTEAFREWVADHPEELDALRRQIELDAALCEESFEGWQERHDGFGEWPEDTFAP